MLLSIIIPTKNRPDELLRVVNIMDSYNNDEFEIIVQDNSDSNLSETVKLASYKHVKYYYNNSHLSVGENIDKGIKHAMGKYVICIGDDDCVSKRIFDVLSYMDHVGADSCCFPTIAFLWENVVRDNAYLKQFTYRKDLTKKNIEVISPQYELKKICRSSSFNLNRLPRVYHGIVLNSLLSNIYELLGTYCPGPSPDVANATAVCMLSQKCIYIPSPLVVAGCCAASAGGLGAKKQHVRKVEEVSWLPDNIKEIWHKKIPYLWTAETIWMVSIICALKNLKKEKFINHVNWGRFYAAFIYYHFPHRNEIKQRRYKLQGYIHIPGLIASGIVRKFKRKYFVITEHKSISTIEMAADEINTMEVNTLNELKK